MGRTGKLWAFAHYGIIPDILTLAKGFGGGLPLGAFISRKEIMQCLTHDPVLGHITTFGGNAVCAAAAKACLETIISEKLWENAERQGKRFRKLLVHPAIKNIRGKGLLMALEFDSFKQCKSIIDACIAKGVVTDWFLFADNCLRIAPPLNITDRDVEKACDLLLQAIDQNSY